MQWQQDMKRVEFELQLCHYLCASHTRQVSGEDLEYSVFSWCNLMNNFSGRLPVTSSLSFPHFTDSSLALQWALGTESQEKTLFILIFPIYFWVGWFWLLFVFSPRGSGPPSSLVHIQDNTTGGTWEEQVAGKGQKWHRAAKASPVPSSARSQLQSIW